MNAITARAGGSVLAPGMFGASLLTDCVDVQHAGPDCLAVQGVDRLMLTGLLRHQSELGQFAFLRGEPLAGGRTVRQEEPAQRADAHRDDAFNKEDHAAPRGGSVSCPLGIRRSVPGGYLEWSAYRHSVSQPMLLILRIPDAKRPPTAPAAAVHTRKQDCPGAERNSQLRKSTSDGHWTTYETEAEFVFAVVTRQIETDSGEHRALRDAQHFGSRVTKRVRSWNRAATCEQRNLTHGNGRPRRRQSCAQMPSRRRTGRTGSRRVEVFFPVPTTCVKFWRYQLADPSESPSKSPGTAAYLLSI